jgi:hypothetical protein
MTAEAEALEFGSHSRQTLFVFERSKFIFKRLKI